jgi:hypothetical protein
MIMKKPSIIAHSAAQGLPARLSPATRLVAVLIYRTSFRLRVGSRASPARIIPAVFRAARSGWEATPTNRCPALILRVAR